MATIASPRATLQDLLRTEGKAELVGGRIVPIMPSGDCPGAVGGEIYVSLRGYSKKKKSGTAYPDGVGYAVRKLPSGRESFCPDASFRAGAKPADRMRFIQGPPTFAAEVRSENDYGPAAELEMAEKRGDYFAAGTLLVWDVDPKAKTITSYSSAAPDQPIVFKSGDMANAEPAVPGWQIAVDDVFDC